MCRDVRFYLQKGLSSPSQGVLALGRETEPGPSWRLYSGSSLARKCLATTVLLQGWCKPRVLQHLLLSPELGSSGSSWVGSLSHEHATHFSNLSKGGPEAWKVKALRHFSPKVAPDFPDGEQMLPN